jgi:hypothetical protein
MKRIQLQNAEKELQGRRVNCYFSGVEFEIGEHLFAFEGYAVDPGYAKRNGFVLDDNFKLPPTINHRGAVTPYLMKTLGIHRGSPEYVQLYKKLSEGLPMSTYEQTRELEKLEKSNNNK